MPNKEFQAYAKAVPVIRAREMLSEITVASFPHMKNEVQKKEHRKLFKTAYPESDAVRKPMTLVDLARVINGRN